MYLKARRQSAKVGSAAMEHITIFDCDDLRDFLVKEGYHEDVVSTFSTNRICSQTFLEMTDEDLKELIPVMGDRIRVRKLLKSVVPQTLVRLLYL